MEACDRRKEQYNQSSGKLNNSIIYAALMILIGGMLLLFVLECYNIQKSECYLEEGKFQVVRKKLRPNLDKIFKPHEGKGLSVAPDRLKSTAYDELISSTEEYSHQTNKSMTLYNANDSNVKVRQIKRQLQLRTYCREQIQPFNPNMGRARNLLYSDNQGVIYCSVPKVACTNWKRMMQVFDGNIEDPLEIPKKQQVHRLKYSFLNKLSKSQKEWRKNLYYSFLFVRHPFERLLSAYRNKLLDPYSTGFQKRYGSKILRLYRKGLTPKQYSMGKNVTFQEFVDFLIYVHEEKGIKYFDEHWQVIHRLCSPCSMKYNFIGKMETLLEDANQVLKEVGVYDKVKFPVNATDRYKKKVKTIMHQYYSTISKSSIDKLYDIYEDDFVAFDYKLPDFL